ncbi:hypothetical protein THAOC_30462, partial [Thalassiosira oceanica]
VTLIGSAEKLIEKSLDERPLFEEDLTQEEVWRLRRGQDADAEMADAVDIVALQREVGMDRDDGKADAYQYNRLVTGLPQRQINDTLVGRKNGPDPTLKGEEAMTLGMELRRAWVLETLRVDAGRASCETSASAGVFSIQIKKSCLYGANKKGNHCCLRIAGPRPSGSECLADQRFCPKGVCVVDLNTQSATHVLDGHKDTVMCVRSLPDGSLLTGGGKLDATVKLWSCDQLERGRRYRRD